MDSGIIAPLSEARIPYFTIPFPALFKEGIINFSSKDNPLIYFNKPLGIRM